MLFSRSPSQWLALAWSLSAVAHGQVYDYAIAGAGTSGLLLALELTKNPNISVIVLEAGTDARRSPSVTVPENEGSITGTQYDWALATVPQPGLPNSPSMRVARGKTIGGTSAMNWMIWNKASAPEYNAWQSVLNLTGWNWTTISSASKAAQNFTVPSGKYAQYYSYAPQDHGTRGLVQGSMPRAAYQLYTSYVMPALRSLGVVTMDDRDGGNSTGAGFNGLAIDAVSYTRSYPGSAYTTVQSRGNLRLVTNALVSHITWTPGSTPLTATGLAYLDNTTSPAAARNVRARNVILSAGLQTPTLLERSGIGNTTLLHALGIPTTLSLPAVGTGLQDHLAVAGSFSISPPGPLANSNYTQAFTDYAAPSRFLNATDHQRLTTLLAPATPPRGIALAPWRLLRALVAADQPLIEFAWYQAFVTTYLLHPLSTGSVHAAAADPTVPPRLDPAYNSATLDGLALDLWLLAKAVHYYALALPPTPAWAPLRAVYSIDPALPFDQFAARIAAGLHSGDHFVGGAALGDVVDARLRVHGTANVRVVDLSVVPTCPGAHPMGLAYAVAEMAVGLLK